MGFRYGDIVVDKEKLYITPAEIAGIIEADIHTGESKILVRFPQYELFTGRMNSTICKLGNFIAVAPLLGKEFYIYNIRENKLVWTTMDETKFANLNKKYLGTKGLFTGSFVYHNCIYFVGNCYPGIVKISTEDASLEVINFDLNRLKALGESREIFLGRYICIKDNYAYIGVKHTSTIIKFNLSNTYCEYITLDSDLHIYEICGNSDKIYFLPSNTGSIKYADLSNLMQINNIKELPEICGKSGEPWFVGGVYKAGYIWILPCFSNMILKINPNDGNIEYIKENSEYKSGFVYTFIKDFDEEHICAFNSRKNCLEIINVFTYEFRKLNISFSDASAEGALKQAFSSHERIQVSESVASLSSMIFAIKECDESDKYKNIEDKVKMGKIIWDAL